jgi:hypothetical protein
MTSSTPIGQENFRVALHQLITDPDFIKFHELIDEPNIFRIVGQTNYERWHSGFWAWLLDIDGSHGLGKYPLELFILHAISNPHFQTKHIDQYQKDFLESSLLFEKHIEDFKISPNERGEREKSARIDGKLAFFDILITATMHENENTQSKTKFAVLVELKVNALSTEGQATRYANHIETAVDSTLHDAKKLLVYILPSSRLSDDTTSPIGDNRWCLVTYQSLHDHVLVHLLNHKRLSAHARWVITEYINNLRTDRKGAVMAYTKEEITLAHAIYDRHRATFDKLSTILQQGMAPEADEYGVNGTTKRIELCVVVNGITIKKKTFRDLAVTVIETLEKTAAWEKLTLPWGFGTSRYFIVNLVSEAGELVEAKHYNGNPFIQPAFVGTPPRYAIETNISRENGLKMLARLCDELGVNWEVKSK